MEQQESQVTKTVREAVIKAAAVGEDLTRKINDIIRDVMADSLSKVEPTKEKVQEVSQDVMNGVTAGLQDAKVKVGDVKLFADGFMEGARLAGEKAASYAAHAVDEVMGDAKQFGDKAVDFIQDVFKGLSAGVKEVVDKKTGDGQKPQDKPK
jgi:hypothetical protein